MAADETQSIAMVYAEALFELAEEQELTAEIRQELTDIAALLDANEAFAVFLDTPAVGRDEKTAVIRKVFEGQVTPLMFHFLLILAKKDRLSLIREVRRSFEKLEDAQAGRVKGSLTTAVTLSEQEQSRLREQIGRALRKTVQLQNVVDPTILGGLVLKVEDTVMDLSVRGALEQSRQNMLEQCAKKLPRGRELLV